jgi:CBS domain-containing protein
LLIASVTFGDISFSVSDPMNVIQQFGPWATILLWLGSVNILVGVFNMIPGFPLDGGRVLRSIIWAVNNDLRKATRWASRIGQAIAWLMIFSGISMMFGAQIPFFGTGFINGLWLVFIGWFLNSASQQSYRQILIRDLLDGVRVKRMMRTRVLMVSPHITVESLVNDHILGSDDQAFPVVENDRLVGMVTLQDVRSAERDRWDELTVSDIMTPQSKLITVSTQDDAADALSKLTQSDVRQLPVMEENEIAGLLRRRDIIRWLQLESHANLA